MSEIKRIDIKEFRKEGFLLEANRQFFHPLGLALEILVDIDRYGAFWYYLKRAFKSLFGRGFPKEYLGGVWDYRDDPEGVLYDDNIVGNKDVFEKSEKVRVLLEGKEKVRREKFGYLIQPIAYNKGD